MKKRILKAAAAMLTVAALTVNGFMPIHAHADYIVSPGVVIGSGNDKIGPWSGTLNASGSNTSAAETVQNVTDNTSGYAAENTDKNTADNTQDSAQDNTVTNSSGTQNSGSNVIYAPGALDKENSGDESQPGSGTDNAGSSNESGPETSQDETKADPALESLKTPNTLVPTADANIFYINGRSIDITKPSIALTYDDGPQTSVGNRIMDIFAKYGQKCTFFMVGDRVASRATEVNRMVAEGHEIANHTYSHVYLNKVGAETVRSQVNACNDILKQVTGVSPLVMRLPGGNKNETVINNVNMPIILWNIDTRDWATRNAEKTRAAVIGHVKGGDIVLMHELYESTADATAVIVPTLVDQGFQLVTVSELAAIRGVNLQPNRVYYSF